MCISQSIFQPFCTPYVYTFIDIPRAFGLKDLFGVSREHKITQFSLLQLGRNTNLAEGYKLYFAQKILENNYG